MCEETSDIMPYGEGSVYGGVVSLNPDEMELANTLKNMGIEQYDICAQKLIKEKTTLQSLLSPKWADIDDLKFC